VSKPRLRVPLGGPNYVPLILQDTAIFLLFLDLGRGPRSADVARFVAIAGISAYQVVQYSIFTPVSVVALIFFGFVAVFAAASRRERFIKLGAAAVLAAVIFGLFGGLLIGIYGFAKPAFFWYEFFQRPGALRPILSHCRALAMAGMGRTPWRSPARSTQRSAA